MNDVIENIPSFILNLREDTLNIWTYLSPPNKHTNSIKLILNYWFFHCLKVLEFQLCIIDTLGTYNWLIEWLIDDCGDPSI